MIIALSGWRGTKTPASNAEIEAAAADVLSRLFWYYPDAQYRSADNPNGWDRAIPRLWRTQQRAGGWYKLGKGGSRSLDSTWRANWRAHGNAAGPLRNRAMLRGDGTDDPTHGVARMLVAMPMPGPMYEGSGTWDCISAAAEFDIPLHVVPLRPRPGYDRMPALPLPSLLPS